MTWGYAFYSFLLVPALAIGYVLGGFWLAVQWAQRSETMLAALSKLIGLILLLALIPSADVALGRMKFDQFCMSSAGAKAYKIVKLEAKHRTPDGHIRRELLRPGSSGYRIGDHYLQQHSVEEVFKWPRIEKFRATYIDERTGDLLGEYVTFHYWGGWLYQFLPGHHSARGCDVQRSPSLEAQVFPPQ